MRSFGVDNRGAILPELAIVLPAVVILFLGVLAVGFGILDQQRTIELARSTAIRLVHDCWLPAQLNEDDGAVRYCLDSVAGDVVTSGAKVENEFQVLLSYYRLIDSNVVRIGVESRHTRDWQAAPQPSQLTTLAIESKFSDRLALNRFLFVVEVYAEREPISAAFSNLFQVGPYRYLFLIV